MLALSRQGRHAKEPRDGHQLQGYHGYGVIQHMRERAEYDDLPILVLTTESDNEKKERARKLGATGFIIKPFNPTGLVDVLRKVAA